MKNIVYIVHAVDTEGPLYESTKATFERLNATFGIKLEPTHENLVKLRNKEIVLDGIEDEVSKFLDPALQNYNDTWDKIEKMHERILSDEFRFANPDSFGNGWIYNWFCMDHVGYEYNPRHRDMGYHNIYDRYLEILDKYGRYKDDVQFHFHPMSHYKEANRAGKSYEHSKTLYQILSRRIIDREFFPAAFRAGCVTERPDANWFLEQWIPFDCSNFAVEDHNKEMHKDQKNGQAGDWRRAPHDWSVYHPDIYDYQVPGLCHRSIGRFLNIVSRYGNITEAEVEKAFKRANDGIPTLLGMFNHDFRDMGKEAEYVQSILQPIAKKYPDVKFKYSRVKDAFNAVLGQEEQPLELDIKLDGENLEVHCTKGKVFGPQPYLAVKTKDGRYFHDNFDFGMDGNSWYYVFNENMLRPNDVDTIGIAANNETGYTFVKTIKVNG